MDDRVSIGSDGLEYPCGAFLPSGSRGATITTLSISVGADGRFQAEIDGMVILNDGFLAIFHDGDWFSTVKALPERKGIIFADPEPSFRKDAPRVIEATGAWEMDGIPACIAIGAASCLRPNFRAWFEYSIDGLPSPVYAVIDGFIGARVMYVHAFWPEPTRSDGIAGFINIGRPPVSACTMSGSISKKSAILAFGNYHENEDGNEMLAFMGGMQVWTTPHYGKNWDGIRSRPPICAMVARVDPRIPVRAVGEACIAWMTVNKWGARTVMHVGNTFLPSEFGAGIKVLATRNCMGARHQHLPGVVIGIGNKPRLLMKDITDHLAGILARPGILRKNKSFPIALDYLGWCTWNALGERRLLSGEHIMDFWRCWEKNYKDVPFRTMIIDDGWQHVEKAAQDVDDGDKNGIVMASFRQNSKLPALTVLRRQIEQFNPDFKYLGVWHTIHGWWGGSVVPGYPVLPGTAGFPDVRPSIPIPPVFPAIQSYLPDPVSNDPVSPAMRFYNDWYACLHEQQVDFTKVDSQNAVASFPSPKTGPDTQMGAVHIDYAARTLHAAKEAASSNHGIPCINCMCQVPTSWQHWTGSAVSRCSGDFCVGDVRYSSFLMHQAAVNQFWYSHFTWGDWDMWNSKEPRPHHAEGMAICRAISGGPVYVTDYPDAACSWADERGGEPGDWLVIPAGTDAGLLKRLADPVTGQIARLAQPAQPNDFSLWNDARVASPGSESFDPLVINNKHHVPGLGDVGYVAIINVTAASTRSTVKMGAPPEERHVQMAYGGKARVCDITREMLLDEPERTHGVDPGATIVIVHEVGTCRASMLRVRPSCEGNPAGNARLVAFPMRLNLAPMQACYFQIIPASGQVIPLGTPDLFNQMWVFETISMEVGTISMDLKFPARIQLFHVQDPLPPEQVEVWGDVGEIPHIQGVGAGTVSGEYWTRDGQCDIIHGRSRHIKYRYT